MHFIHMQGPMLPYYKFHLDDLFVNEIQPKTIEVYNINIIAYYKFQKRKIIYSKSCLPQNVSEWNIVSGKHKQNHQGRYFKFFICQGNSFIGNIGNNLIAAIKSLFFSTPFWCIYLLFLVFNLGYSWATGFPWPCQLDGIWRRRDLWRLQCTNICDRCSGE